MGHQTNLYNKSLNPGNFSAAPFGLLNEKVKSKSNPVEGYVRPLLHDYAQTPPGLLQKDTTESIMQYEQHALAFLSSFLHCCCSVSQSRLNSSQLNTGSFKKRTSQNAGLQHSPSPVHFTRAAFAGSTARVMNKLARGF